MEQAIQPVKAPKARKRIKKRWIVLGVAVVLIAVLVLYVTSAAQSATASLLAFDDTTVLAPAELVSSISGTGRVVSANSRNVYSTQAYPVETIHVEVGDTVREGDPLCTLDATTLNEQIEKFELQMKQSSASAAQQVKTARDNYNAAKDALSAGTNSSLLSSQNAVDNAYTNYLNAQDSYERFKTNKDRGLNTALITAEANLESATRTLTAAKNANGNSASQDQINAAQAAIDQAEATLLAAEKALLLAQSAFDAASNDANADALALAKQARDNAILQRDAKKATFTALTSSGSSSTSVYAAQQAYDAAYTQWEAAKNTAKYTLEDYEKAVETAYNTYVTAQKSQEATESSVDSQLKQSLNSLKSSQIGANNDVSVLELENMKESLEDTVVKSPISGTVTAVYATLGANGSGLLFVVEDTENLRVETTVKEYDMATMRAGLPVIIKSDSTNNVPFDGRIRTISPASQKTAAGTINTSGDVLFDTEVEVTTLDTGLKIGMSVRLSIVVGQKADILTVPYEAVYQNAAGQDCIIVAQEQADSKFLLTEMPVTTGMESDLYIEISGDGVISGLRVVNTPDTFRMLIGTEVAVTDHRVYTAGGSAAMPGMMVRGG